MRVCARCVRPFSFRSTHNATIPSSSLLSLLGLAILLALANVGSSFAAAYLSKDTKTDEAKLVDSKTGDTVKTDSTTKIFVIGKTKALNDGDYQRRLDCAEGDEGCTTQGVWGAMTEDDAQELIATCANGGEATLRRHFEHGLVDHSICPVHHPDHKAISYHCEDQRMLEGLTVTFKNDDEQITILPREDCGGGYVIAGLTSAHGEACDADAHCASPLTCDEGFCKTPVPPQGGAAAMQRYLVGFATQDGDPPSQKCDALARAHGGTPGRAFARVFNGCVLTLPPQAAAGVRNNPNVRSVEEDSAGTLAATAPWGQDRMDQCANDAEAPLDGAKQVLGAADVMVFVMDTGIKGDHAAFFGGLIDAANDCHVDTTDTYQVDTQNTDPLQDVHGHG